MDGSPAHGPAGRARGVSRARGRDEGPGRAARTAPGRRQRPRRASVRTARSTRHARRRRRASRRGELDRDVRVRLRPARLRQQPRDRGKAIGAGAERRSACLTTVVSTTHGSISPAARPTRAHRWGSYGSRRSSSALRRGRAGRLLGGLRAGRRRADPDRDDDRRRGRRVTSDVSALRARRARAALAPLRARCGACGLIAADGQGDRERRAFAGGRLDGQRPPWASAMARTIASPSPEPHSRDRGARPGRRCAPWSSTGMPHPSRRR